ncbi:MAG: PLP-dependent aminotransferase family protein [Pseudomonadales bacterium]|nr:PLP-dependent aminotransferase family protein [Pseudomonadales bacterium]
MQNQLLYQQVAHKIEESINLGIYRSGEKLPGVRRLSDDFRVSIGTVLEALYQLQNKGKLEARPRSGYYVCEQSNHLPEAIRSSPQQTQPKTVSNQSTALFLAQASSNAKVLNLGAALPHSDYQPISTLTRHFRGALRDNPKAVSSYEFPPGFLPLRKVVSARMLNAGIRFNPEQITITNGCQEAVTICLSVVAKPADVIAVESPAYYGLLQCIESLGMQALELKTDPVTGVSPAILDSALKRWPVKACVLSANGNNPLGYITSEENKRELLKILKTHDVPLIEDDIYGDLPLTGTRPKAMSAFAERQRFFYCSSVSKTISPAIRIGWIASYTNNEELNHAKFLRNIATASIDQIALARYLSTKSYDRHIETCCIHYANNATKVRQAVGKYFPTGTRTTHPQAGFAIWVQLPRTIDGDALSYACLSKNIGIFPGKLFSASGRYSNCIRLSCAQPITSNVIEGLKNVGNIANSLT